MAEINDTWHNNYIEGVVNAHYSIFEIRSFKASWWKTELFANMWFWEGGLAHMCTQVSEKLYDRIQ